MIWFIAVSFQEEKTGRGVGMFQTWQCAGLGQGAAALKIGLAAIWSLDFVHDQFACRRFRVLNIVDDVTRECLVAIPDASAVASRGN